MDIPGRRVKLLVDTCVAGSVVAALRSRGFDVKWTAERPRDPGDEVIVEQASAEGRIMITRDKDFGTLIFRDRRSHCGVLRLSGAMTYDEQARHALRALEEHGDALASGHIVTVDLGRIRVSRRSANSN